MVVTNDGSAHAYLACVDGALHLWKANSNFVRPDLSIEGAHAKGSETGSIVFSVDDRTLLTRGGDDTVKRELFQPRRIATILLNVSPVWDIRSFRKPLVERSDVKTLYPTTNAVFSPDEKYVVTGAGATVKGGRGRLLFLRRGDLEVAKEVETDSTPVKVLWHPKINQVSAPVSDI